MARVFAYRKLVLNNVTNQQSDISIIGNEEANSIDNNIDIINNSPKKGKDGEQAIFMQVKCKEDVVANTQTTAQDWRKDMVSSIENVKGFADTTGGNNNCESGAEAEGKSDERIVTTNGNFINSKTSNDNLSNKCVKSDGSTNGTEPMEVDSVIKGSLELKRDTTPSSSTKLVNGNGTVHVASTGESGDDSRTKTDDDGVSKEGMQNGVGEIVKETGEVKSEAKLVASESVVVNGTSGASDTGACINNKDNKAQVAKTETDGNGCSVRATTSAPPLTVSTFPSSISKKDASSSIPPPVMSTTSSGQPAVNLIAVRKKNKNAPEEAPRVTKKVKLITPGAPSTADTDISKLSHHQGAGSSSIVSTSSIGLCPPPRPVILRTSPSRTESSSSKSHHHRLPPMKAEAMLHLQVNSKPDCSYSLHVTNHFQRPDGTCHQLVCSHTPTSLNGLEWTMCTDAPICGLTGDMHRIVIVCENATAHVLDVKGRYAFPPIMLSGHPSKTVQNGPFLVVVTSKAVIHVWNIHTKSVVLKSESLLPLLTYSDSEKERVLDISRIQLAAGGLPIIVLNTGRTFMYSAELTTWFLLSDPRGSVSSPLISNAKDQSLSNRMMLFSGNGRLRSKPEPAIVSHIKLKLATCTEMKNPEGIKQWLIALAKSLATNGLEKELHQLCEDLLGPTHSAARFTTKWVPTIIGVVDKRKLLRQILILLLEDLKYQDLYSEFDEILREVENQNENELLFAAPPSNSTAATTS